MRMEIIVKELQEIKEKYGNPRRTEIEYAGEDFNPEDFYADEDMVLTISHLDTLKEPR
jgi:DNA gyrase subunit A